MCRSSHYNKWTNHPKFRYWKGHHHGRAAYQSRWQYPPVNVQELDDQYQLFVYASGFKKEDFSVSIVADSLVIKAEGKESETAHTGWRRQEFYTGGFERRFQLPEGVDVDHIQARYQEGVLELTLPKQSGFETIRKSVDIQ